MFAINPFAALSASIPPALMQGYVILMILLVAAGTLFDFGKGKLVPFPALIDELIDLIAEDASVLGCEREVRHALNIATGGTSADRQVERYKQLVADGADKEAALIGVVDQLIAETVAGT